MTDIYRQSCPPPPEPVIITMGDSSLYVVNANILFRCDGCKCEWRMSDTFNLGSESESAAFNYLQLAWSYKHQRCVR